MSTLEEALTDAQAARDAYADRLARLTAVEAEKLSERLGLPPGVRVEYDLTPMLLIP